MGDSPRSRSITIVNDDPSRLILVTESVVKRLKGSAKPREVPEEPVHSVSSAPDLGRKRETLAAREEELLEIEKYWMERLQQMDDRHTKINNLSSKDFDKALADYERKFGSPTLSVPKCHLNMKDILACYKDNPNQTLKCNKEIRAFSNCLDNLYVENCR